MKSQLLSLYERRFGYKPEAITDLRADGSNRLLYRIFGPDGGSVVGVFGPDHEENRAFLSFSRSFHAAGLPVPEIYDADEEAGVYIEEDLGDLTLFNALSAARADEAFPEEILTIYRDVVTILPRLQVEGGRVIDFSVAYPCAEFDRKSMTWDLNYFKYHFLKLAHIPFNEARLEADFERLCDFLLRADRSHFLYRDFQSRNIMLRGGGAGNGLAGRPSPWFIDYQGGRKGALQYDLASLLYDAKAAIPEPVRDELLDVYLDALAEYQDVDRDHFIECYRGFVLIRIMQAMGAYGYRGFFERKPHFLASVPYAIANIESLMAGGLPIDLPELSALFEHIISIDDLREVSSQWSVVSSRSEDEDEDENEDENKNEDVSDSEGDTPSIERSTSTTEHRPTPDFRLPTPDSSSIAAAPSAPALRVTITSFSYRHGYPESTSGHGGGFVFDCRALHNPGRYDQYKALCGRDADVVEFLEKEESVAIFWESVRALVDNAVRTYLDRGFTDLSVSFGCTGGQHRSVYFAERLARHLAEHYPSIRIELHHREEERWARREEVRMEDSE